MPIGAEMVWAIAGEIRQRFTGRRTRKIEGGDRWLLLSFGGQGHDLFFSWDAQQYGCCTVNSEHWKGLAALARSTPPLLSALRAHIAGSELIAAEQLGHDRVLCLSFIKSIAAGITQKRQLIFEPSGRHSNLILTNEEGKIIETAKHIYPEVNRFRSTLPGLSYTLPPAFEGPLPQEYLQNPTAPISKVRGIGAPLLARFQGAECLRPFTEDFTPSDTWVYQMFGNYLTLYPYVLPEAKALQTSSPLQAAAEVCFAPLLAGGSKQRRKKLCDSIHTRLKRTQRKIEEAEKLLNDPEIEGLQQMGTLLLSNSWKIPKGAEKATLTEWTEQGEISHCVRLDPRKDVSANAKRYFDSYRKKKAARTRAQEVLPSLQGEQRALEEQLFSVEYQENPEILALLEREILETEERGQKSRRKNAQQLPPHKRFDLPELGVLIYVGLSAKGNHYVTFKMGRAEDVWFHAQNIPGAHVILRFTSLPNEQTEEHCFQLAASLAAWYSKARDEGRVRVDTTQRKHVRPISGGGLAHVTYRDFSTINADPKLWQGELEAEK